MTYLPTTYPPIFLPLKSNFSSNAYLLENSPKMKIIYIDSVSDDYLSVYWALQLTKKIVLVILKFQKYQDFFNDGSRRDKTVRNWIKRKIERKMKIELKLLSL